MFGRNPLLRPANFRPENLGQNALAVIGNLWFTIFVVGVLTFTIMAVTYQPEDPLSHPSAKIKNFLTFTTNTTFKSDLTKVMTEEDFMASNQTVFANFIDIADVDNNEQTSSNLDCKDEVDKPIDCTDSEVFHVMMKAAIEKFKDIHFYRFGKGVKGTDDSSCHMAWQFKSKNGKAVSFYKDYRHFVISRSENCTVTVVSIGDYHSGANARKRRKNQQAGFEESPKQGKQAMVLPEVGGMVNYSLPVVKSEDSFIRGRYLIYVGGGDRCKNMNHYLWSLTCALGEAQYLKRTLVMDLSICLSSIYTSSNQDEEGKDFRFYFDFEHLKESASVLDQGQFWSYWNKWHQKNKLSLRLVEEFKTTPIILRKVKDTLIMRKFGTVEPDNYWYRVCEGQTESVVQRPWHLVWKSKMLMDIVSSITSKLNWDFDSIHVVRGEKARNKELWPNLEADTSPQSILSTLQDKIENGRNLYVATDEPNTSFFDPLKDKYSTHFLDEYNDLWDETSQWYSETKKLNKGISVEFDGYMRISVDTEVFLRGKKQLETFNNLTRACKDGVNTCSSSAS